MDLLSWKAFTYPDSEVISRLLSFLKTHQNVEKHIRDFIWKIPHVYVCFIRELNSSKMIHMLYIVCGNDHSRMTGCKYHIIFKSQLKRNKNNFCKVCPEDTSLFCSTESSRRGKMHNKKQNNLVSAIASIKVHHSTLFIWILFLKFYVICFCFFLLHEIDFPQRNYMVYIFIFTTCVEFKRLTKHSKWACNTFHLRLGAKYKG